MFILRTYGCEQIGLNLRVASRIIANVYAMNCAFFGITANYSPLQNYITREFLEFALCYPIESFSL